MNMFFVKESLSRNFGCSQTSYKKVFQKVHKTYVERFTGIDKNYQNITVNLFFGCKKQNIITRGPMDSFLRKPDIRVFSDDYSTIFFFDKRN